MFSATVFDARGKHMAWCFWKVWVAVWRRSLILSSGVHVIVLGFTDKFLLLDSPVLEPDGDLTLWEVGGGRDAPSLVFGDEFAGCILFLQLLQLDLGVRDPLFTPTTVTADLRLQWHHICEKRRKSQITGKHRDMHRNIAMFHLTKSSSTAAVRASLLQEQTEECLRLNTDFSALINKN